LAVPLITALLFSLLLVPRSVAGDYVLVLDLSGSMTNRISKQDKRIRIEVVQQALRDYLPALPENSRVRLIGFNSGIVADKEVKLSDAPALRQALAWVDDLGKETRKNRQTYLWTTLRHALNVAVTYAGEGSPQPVVVRVLTDGEDNENATTLAKVLQEFVPSLDGEHIRGNLILLGDLEFKTKLAHLALPEGAFETTTNSLWLDLFPPVVLSVPAEPKIGEEVRLFENTKSIYSHYEWLVDGAAVGNEKVLTWRFTEPRTYRVTLRVLGLQGTKNQTTVLIRAKGHDKLPVDFIAMPAQPEPQQEVRLLARCGSQAVRFVWQVDSNQVSALQDCSFRFDREGAHEVKLVAWDSVGTAGTRSQIIQVREKGLTVSIKGPNESVSGRPVQFASEITGACASVEWAFGDGEKSKEKNPQHPFNCGAPEFRDCLVTLRAVTPSGKVVQAVPHSVRVWAEKKVQPPRASFRMLNQNPKAGDVLQLVDDSQGLVESWEWEVIGEATNHQHSPAIRVTSPGAKTIRLKVSGPGGTSSVTNTIVLNPRYAAVKTKATASPQSGEAPLKVQMTSEITGDFRSVRWAFGDGQFSTNVSPSHTFIQASNYTVAVVVYPSDPAQTPVESRFVVNVRKPVPAWAKALPFVGCSALLAGAALLLASHRRKTALRLPVYFWPEDFSVCRSVALTRADEVRELTSEAPIRIKRAGKSSNLVVEPVNGAVLLSSSGQELTSQNIGRGARILVRGKSASVRAIAVSTLQQPKKPSPASLGGEPFSETPNATPPPHEDFEWGWEATEPTKTN
jgi:PKD repeat protein